MTKFTPTTKHAIHITYTDGTMQLTKGKQGRRKEEVYAVIFQRKGHKKVGITLTRSGAEMLRNLLYAGQQHFPITPVTK